MNVLNAKDLKIIQEHFDRVQATISKYGILPEDIFNFDETGFAIGLCNDRSGTIVRMWVWATEHLLSRLLWEQDCGTDTKK